MKNASVWIYIYLWQSSQSYVPQNRLSLVPQFFPVTSIHRGHQRSRIFAVDQETSKTVVIVGAGVGGLAVASRLASSLSRTEKLNEGRRRARIIVLEKNSEEWIGGRCGSFNVEVAGYGSFRHERGPSLLLLKDQYLDLFHDCSQGAKSAQDYGLDIVQCAPAYQVVFDDGDYIHLGFPKRNMGSDISLSILEERTKRKMNEFEENGGSKWDEYMQIMDAYLNCGLPNFIEHKLDLSSFPAFLTEAFRDFAKAWPLKPHSDLLDKLFSSSKMKAMASFQDLYVGLEPYRNAHQIFGGVLSKTALSVFGLLAAIELHPTNKRAGGTST